MSIRRSGSVRSTPGEAVDWTNLQPLIATASEPVTGGWFLLATLVAQGAYNPRL